MLNVKNAFATTLMLGATGLAFPAISTPAAALPLAGLDPAIARDAGPAGQIEQARWVCGPYRCWWRPNYYYGPGYGYGYGPRWGYGRRWGYGYHPGWGYGGGWGGGWRRW
jgi:hypothetical protein